jgi:hypothetical protein
MNMSKEMKLNTEWSHLNNNNSNNNPLTLTDWLTDRQSECDFDFDFDVEGPIKPILTEDLCVTQKEEFSMTCYMCEMYTWRKAKHIHKRQNNLLVREDIT